MSAAPRATLNRLAAQVEKLKEDSRLANADWPTSLGELQRAMDAAGIDLESLASLNYCEWPPTGWRNA